VWLCCVVVWVWLCGVVMLCGVVWLCGVVMLCGCVVVWVWLCGVVMLCGCVVVWVWLCGLGYGHTAFGGKPVFGFVARLLSVVQHPPVDHQFQRV